MSVSTKKTFVHEGSGISALTSRCKEPRPQTLAHSKEIVDSIRRDDVSYNPSPQDWRDEILYFLLPDRFSDGNESERPMLNRQEIHNLRNNEEFADWNWSDWAESGKRWQGGTIRGIQSKLDYLKKLGVTTIWTGPVFKQRKRMNTSHGYGIQDFLDIDPRFGTREDLNALVQSAHAKGMYVILDIIFNHSGDNWGYVPENETLSRKNGLAPYLAWPNFYGNPNDGNASKWNIIWRDEKQNGADIHSADDGVWPKELQQKEIYTRAGSGNLGSGSIENPHAEHKRSDFMTLKDFALDVKPALSYLVDIYKYWIAISDCDGFRIDTVKHVSLEEARNFSGAIKEYAESIGKRNFFLVGEMAGGEHVQDYYIDALGLMQRNLNAALDIGHARVALESVGKGLQRGFDYFNGFSEHDTGFGSHRVLGNQHVSILNDHDHVFGRKLRFSAEIPDDMATKDYQIVVPTAIQLFTLGIPCIYYGSEQAFSGPPQSQTRYLLDHGWGQSDNWGDRYLRECMFGPGHPQVDYEDTPDAAMGDLDIRLPGFGAFGTSDRHVFDESSPSYRRMAALNKVRAEHTVLRTGRQYPRAIRFGTENFTAPEHQDAGSLIAWSRILDNQEALCIVNPNGVQSASGDIIISAELSGQGERFDVIVNTAHTVQPDSYSGAHPLGSAVPVQQDVNSPNRFVRIEHLPPCEVLVLLK